jgi:hypothetical protein
MKSMCKPVSIYSEETVSILEENLLLICCSVHFLTLSRPGINVIDAAARGASTAIGLVSNIAANLIAILSILKFINVTLTWFGQRVGIPLLTFQVKNNNKSNDVER